MTAFLPPDDGFISNPVQLYDTALSNTGFVAVIGVIVPFKGQ